MTPYPKWTRLTGHPPIGTAVQFHYLFRGFREGQGTGTASFEAKLLWKLTSEREEVLYVFFLDLQKSYDALDRERYMEILVEYGFGPRMEIILWYYWDHISMVARSGDYYGTPFKGH